MKLRQKIIRAALDFATVLPHEDIRQAAIRLLEGSKTYIARGEKILAWFGRSAESRPIEFEAYYRCFLTEKGAPFKDFGSANILKSYPNLESILKNEAERLETVCQRIATAQIAEVTEAILRISMEIIARYKKRKEAQAALDYNDLIIHTDRLLHRSGIAPWVLYKLDGGIDHMLVDEAQDTSRDQWSIVQALADEFFSGKGADKNTKRTLFVVGDEKQSIFSFQDADPDAFADMQKTFARRIQENGDELRRVPMHVSFRSAKAILDAVDTIFSKPQSPRRRFDGARPSCHRSFASQ